MADPENTLLLETSKGSVKIDLRPDLAPGHVERIK
ncbi:MAG TPA: peptidylprolyl isomerase, partial [Hyphomonas sp.]|nr:peptidylprolyl isomerase [Hyphomonas sp.]HAQ76737.1 peptidylprolyl isomerase [Hyphomonas sp.]HBX98128.1 peptidylprolyl isomerase [Hyphomonas sp.]HCJ19740.1 peptidylprolyl isomerase [Hyphomonas sp.]